MADFEKKKVRTQLFLHRFFAENQVAVLSFIETDTFFRTLTRLTNIHSLFLCPQSINARRKRSFPQLDSKWFIRAAIVLKIWWDPETLIGNKKQSLFYFMCGAFFFFFFFQYFIYIYIYSIPCGLEFPNLGKCMYFWII